MIRALVLVAAALSVAGLVACSDDKAAETPKPEAVKAAVDAMPTPPPPTTPPPVPVPTEAAATTPPPPNPPPPAAPAEKGSGW